MKVYIALFIALMATAAGAGHTDTASASASAAGGTPNLRGVADVVAAFGNTPPCSDKDDCAFGMHCEDGSCYSNKPENVDPIVESNCGSDECNSHGQGCPPRFICRIPPLMDCGECVQEYETVEIEKSYEEENGARRGS